MPCFASDTCSSCGPSELQSFKSVLFDTEVINMDSSKELSNGEIIFNEFLYCEKYLIEDLILRLTEITKVSPCLCVGRGSTHWSTHNPSSSIRSWAWFHAQDIQHSSVVPSFPWTLSSVLRVRSPQSFTKGWCKLEISAFTHKLGKSYQS